MNLDAGIANGRWMLNILVSVTEFERKTMLERQREGIAKAKADGRYKSRKPTQCAKREEIEELITKSVGATEIARCLNMSCSSVYRIASGN